jgi:hypothetical protein
MMSDRLMTAEEIEQMTGWKRYSKQVQWFMDQFSVKVAVCADGSPVMTWANFNALNARRLGLSSAEPAPKKRLVLVSDSRTAK